MTWFRAGGGGIPASLKNGMNAVLNKKFGTSGQTYAPSDWPDDVNLLGKLPEKTVSGTIAHITDGADAVPIKNLICSIPANLEGVSSIEVARTGKNLLLPCTTGLSGTKNGVTYSYDVASQKFVFSGTNEKTDASWLILNISAYVLGGIKAGGTYTYSHSLTDNMYSQITYYNTDNSVKVLCYLKGNSTQNAKVTFTVPSDFDRLRDFQLGVSNTSSIIDEETGAQVEAGSTATDYEPYNEPTTDMVSLGRTIYGGSVDAVSGEGEVICGRIVYDGSENWNVYASGNGYSIGLPSMERGTWYTSPLAICDIFPKVPNNDNLGVRIGVNNDGIYVVQANTIEGVNDLSSFKQYLSQNNMTIIYPLATHTDFEATTITPTPETKLGDNTIWNDAGDTAVTYRADIDLALAQLSGTRGLMMASRSPMIGEEASLDRENILEEVSENLDNEESEEER